MAGSGWGGCASGLPLPAGEREPRTAGLASRLAHPGGQGEPTDTDAERLEEVGMGIHRGGSHSSKKSQVVVSSNDGAGCSFPYTLHFMEIGI